MELAYTLEKRQRGLYEIHRADGSLVFTVPTLQEARGTLARLNDPRKAWEYAAGVDETRARKESLEAA